MFFVAVCFELQATEKTDKPTKSSQQEAIERNESRLKARSFYSF